MTDHWGAWWILLFVIPFLFARPWCARHRGSGRSERSDREKPEESVRARLDLVDQLEARVAELENRLDFTERLLAQRGAEDQAGRL